MTTPASNTSNAATAPSPLSGGAVAQLRRLRWAVRATLTLGVAASVAANVLHARPNPISQIIAAWPPLALLLTVELISRVPHHRRALGIIRIAATAVIAGIATWVSYWHLVGVAARYGETEAAAAYLLPLSVDGLVVVASVSLVEITGRLRTTTTPRGASEPVPGPGRRPQPDHPSCTVLTTTTSAASPVTNPAARPSFTDEPDGELQPAMSPAASPPRVPAVQKASKLMHDPPLAGDHKRVDGAGQPEPASADQATPARSGDRPEGNQADALRCTYAEANTQDRQPAAAPATGPADQAPPRPDGHPADRKHPHSGTGSDRDVVPPGTAAAVAYWRRRDPRLHPAQIAARIGRSERTVRRHWPPPDGDSPRANGNLPTARRR
ncbi:DUF2637 domain-containing protein [Micromonospora echinospora]